MKTSFPLAVLLALLLSTAPVVAPVQATTAIQRCASADGSMVYTDKACSSLGASNVAIPGALLTRIAHEEARFANTAGDDAVMPAVAPSSLRRRSPASGCARTPTQLAMDLRGALVLGDVNRVAESYDWRGMSSKQGRQTMDRLQRLIGKPVLDSHYFAAQIALAGDADVGSLLASNSGDGGDGDVLQLVLGDHASRSAIDFDVHKTLGCYFVHF
ncbi:hypothetical protein [Cognatiluteimonas profundi]|uniref:hypothetical protein n=1 Tax=Cognatiluteimonas profundi TaxID=2594501 RepID=UPI00131D1B47|nr:hypothetical protein [Lysobacter profundi]